MSPPDGLSDSDASESEDKSAARARLIKARGSDTRAHRTADSYTDQPVRRFAMLEPHFLNQAALEHIFRLPTRIGMRKWIRTGRGSAQKTWCQRLADQFLCVCVVEVAKQVKRISLHRDRGAGGKAFYSAPIPL